MRRRAPAARLMLAGTGSGAGKTTLAAGILAALRRRGLSVRGFKVGPDFLDPTYLTLAADRQAYNLDFHLQGPEGARRLLAAGLDGMEFGLVEGMMGLFDGRGPASLTGSSAEWALDTATPVVLVVDAAGMALSAAAVVHGFASLEPTLRLSGVLFNRVGSQGHYRWLEQALAARGLPPALGYLPGDDALHLPERHLGLIPAHDWEGASAWLDRLAETVARTVDLEQLLAVAASAPPVPSPPSPQPKAGPPVTVAYAWDAAFRFYYASSFDALRQQGALLVPFSPLRDRALPEGACAVLLGGGYPELHARELAANAPLVAELRRFSGPILAECGGLLYLARSLTDAAGLRHRLVGRVPAHFAMAPSLAALGYGTATTLKRTILGPRGTKLQGHVFHWSRLVRGSPNALWVASRAQRDGFARANLLASYLHVDLAGHPDAARSLMAHARGYARAHNG